jgi:sugar phosphate isomerase/epimerase
MGNFNTAVASYSFHGLLGEGKCDVFGYLNMLRYRYNVDYADIWTGFLPTLDEDFIKKVREELDRRDLKLANLCVDGPHVWMDSEEDRAAHKAQMLEYIKAAKTLGAQTIRIDFGGSDGYTMPDEAFEYIAATYREYCAICYDYGMKIGPENHWGWDRVPAYLKKVKEAVDHPAYGHLYHFRNFYDNAEEGEALCVSYAMHTHVHANSMPYAKSVFAKLDAAGYEGVYSVEHHSGRLECERVEWQLATVRGLIAELKEGNAEKDFFTEIYG